MSGIALLLYPGLGLALSECKQRLSYLFEGHLPVDVLCYFPISCCRMGGHWVDSSFCSTPG